MIATNAGRSTSELIAALDSAVGAVGVDAICQRVKHVLEEFIRPGTDLLAPRFLAPDPQRYARRLIHADPQMRYTVLAMVWGPQQGTPLHDHASMWCVEYVYRGNIRVTSYASRGQRDGLHAFERETEIIAGVGEAGALIPPFEYHTIANADATPSVTIHVYGGEMTHCHIFAPDRDGLYRREPRQLCYTD